MTNTITNTIEDGLAGVDPMTNTITNTIEDEKIEVFLGGPTENVRKLIATCSDEMTK